MDKHSQIRAIQYVSALSMYRILLSSCLILSKFSKVISNAERKSPSSAAQPRSDGKSAERLSRRFLTD